MATVVLCFCIVPWIRPTLCCINLSASVQIPGCFRRDCGWNKMCLLLKRGVCLQSCGGSYLLTVAVLAAFSSACCCKTFRLTFHAEIKIADKLERKPVQREEIKASSVSTVLRLVDRISVWIPRRVKKSLFFWLMQVGIHSLRVSVPFIMGMSGENNEDYN